MHTCMYMYGGRLKIIKILAPKKNSVRAHCTSSFKCQYQWEVEMMVKICQQISPVISDGLHSSSSMQWQLHILTKSTELSI